jgi:hypothetical protein
MDGHDAERVLRASGVDVAALLKDPSRGPGRTAVGRRPLVLLLATTEGPHPEFCSYRNRRGKRCEQRARWRERDGVLGYCTMHRASAGLDDPTA